MHRTVKLAILAALLLLGGGLRAEAPSPGPHPDLDPMQVVERMIAAMKKGDDEGIAELYAFASPGNRAQVGPLSRFTEMMHEYFPDMLAHERARAAPPLIDQGRAMIPVEFLSGSGSVSQYVIMLSVQKEGVCTGCWMTDAVVPPEALQGLPAPQNSPGEGA